MEKCTKLLRAFFTLSIAIGAFVTFGITAFAAPDDYSVTGGDIAALPVVGAASTAINTITLTDAGGDDFSDANATEVFIVTLNNTSYPSVQFDQTVVFGGLTVGGDCGHTSASALTFTDAYTANVTVTGAGGVGTCAAGETVTIAGLKIKTVYAATAPVAAKLVSVDNSVTSLGSTVASTTTMTLAVTAATDVTAEIALGTNSVVGAAGTTTITLTTPFALDPDDTIDITFPDYIDISAVDAQVATGTFDNGDAATITCQDSSQVLTCTISAANTATTGTIILTGIVSRAVGTTDITVFEVENEGVAANDIVVEATVALTDVTVSDAAATIALGTNSVVGATGNTTLTITLGYAMANGDTIVFTAPANLNVSGVAAAVTGTLEDTDTITCANTSGQIITCTTTGAVSAKTGTIIMTGIKSTYVAASGMQVTSLAVNDTSLSGADISSDSASTDMTATTVGALTAASVTPADMTASQYNQHIIAFTTTTTIPNLGKIKITYPSGWNVESVSGLTAHTLSGLNGTWTASVSGQIVTLTQTGGTLTAAGAKSLKLESIKAPTAPGSGGNATILTEIADGSDIETLTASTGTVIAGSTTSSWDSTTTTTTTTPATTTSTTTTTTTTTTPATSTDTTEETDTTTGTEETSTTGTSVEETPTVVTTTSGATVEINDISTHWAEPKIEAMVEKEVIKGKEGGKFEPESQLNRAEAAAMLYRVLGMDDPAVPTVATFGDVALNAWYAGYVKYLADLDLVSGKTATSFAPLNNITRAEFLALAMRVYHYVTGTETPADQMTTTKYADALPAWAAGLISEATDKGFVNGSEVEGKFYFKANTTITRAEAAAILYNMFYTMLQ